MLGSFAISSSEDDEFRLSVFIEFNGMVEPLCEDGGGFVMPGCCPQYNNAIGVAVTAEMANTMDIPKLCSNVSEYQKEYRENDVRRRRRDITAFQQKFRFNVPLL